MVDDNHAPPGAGYLHVLFILVTTDRPELTAKFAEYSGVNRFIEGGYPTNFTNATVTLRLRGELDGKGSELVLLAQANVGDVSVNYVLTGQPFRVTPDWSEQPVTLAPDPRHWQCLGTRHDLTHQYGYGDLADVLRNVDISLLLVLFPLDVAPAGPVDGDPHLLRAGRDYPVDQSGLAEGYVSLDEVRIDFAEG